MHRAPLLNLLYTYEPSFSEEKVFQQEIVDFVRAHPDCFERSQKKGHITSSSWLLNKTGQKALLTHHAKLGIWCQLGGHCDGESDTLKSAIREAQEESGITAITAIQPQIFDLDVHEIPATAKEPSHLHYDIRFLLRVISDEEARPSHESKALHWINLGEASSFSKESGILRMEEKWAKVIDTLTQI